MQERLKHALTSDGFKKSLEFLSRMGWAFFIVSLSQVVFIYIILAILGESPSLSDFLGDFFHCACGAGLCCLSYMGRFFSDSTVKLINKVEIAERKAAEEDEKYINDLKVQYNIKNRVPTLSFLAAQSIIKDEIEEKEFFQITTQAQEVIKNVQKMQDGPNSKMWTKHFKII